MSDFAGNEELLRDFLTEAAELLADVDNRLVALEERPGEPELLNAVFRGFHTIKGGAGFLGATELVRLCHLTENLFDRLRSGETALTPESMDVILTATGEVRAMFESLGCGRQPGAAPAALLAALESAIASKTGEGEPCATAPAAAAAAAAPHRVSAPQPDWAALLAGLTEPRLPRQVEKPAAGRALASVPAAPASKAAPRAAPRDEPGVATISGKGAAAKDATIRIDTARLDQVLNLSGEIGLAKNRLTCLRTELLSGRIDAQHLRALDEAIGQLDLLVGDLQNAVMKTRMQPVGRVFRKYPRLVRDLARQLGKEVELRLLGEDTELDRTMIEELSDPLLHLVRNAVDHGMETPAERSAAGKPEKGSIVLSARHAGDRVVIEISDDGRGMRADVLRRKALEKQLLDPDAIHGMDDRQALQLVFLPGFSTKDEISSISGRGVGMDVVKTNIQKLNGRIEIASAPGTGTTISIALPLTLAILPVLMVRIAGQPFALPLAVVREIIPLDPAQIQSVSGKATLVVRDEVLPVRSLAAMLGFAGDGTPRYGVLVHTTTSALILAVDGFVGRDDVVIKPLDGMRPRGVAGATLSGDGSVVLVLDVEALFIDAPAERHARLFARAA